MRNDQDAIREAIRMAQTPAGKQLIQMLQSSGDPNLQKAMTSAASGDYSAAKQALSAILSNPEAQMLLQQMGGNYGPDGR
jgi:hypothetical protein